MAWIEFDVPELKPMLDEWRAKHGISEGDTPDPHVTLVFGVPVTDENRRKVPDIIRRVTGGKPLTVSTGRVRKGDFSPVLLIDLLPEGRTLMNLFWEIYNGASNQTHRMKHNRYAPHVTIVWMGQEQFDAFKVGRLENFSDPPTKMTVRRLTWYDALDNVVETFDLTE